ELLAVSLNKETPQAPEFVDRLDTWYGRPEIPIGVIEDGPACYLDDYCAKVCAMKNDSGDDLFPRSLAGYDDLLPAHILYRKVLAGQTDRSVTVVSVGFSTNLARLLATGPDEYSPLSGKDLMLRKVKEVVMTGGMFVPEDKPEFNIRKDVAAARTLFAECPVPVIVSPGEVGSRVQYPAESVENDFSWADAHPLVESYKAYKPMPYDRNCWDLMAVLYAVEGESNDYFNLSPRVRIAISEEGFTTCEYDADSEVRYLQVQDEQVARIKERFIGMITEIPKIYNK
ncbi:MAG: nucleoside hydrolase, partial [Bacteroidales bacterium]|nr:nucleoside hydrolase [Bacteroidales bacterium]